MQYVVVPAFSIYMIAAMAPLMSILVRHPSSCLGTSFACFISGCARTHILHPIRKILRHHNSVIMAQVSVLEVELKGKFLLSTLKFSLFQFAVK